MLITSDEEVLDSIIKNNGLNDVLIYILENYSKDINYNTVCTCLDPIELVKTIKEDKEYNSNFNTDVLSVFNNKEISEYTGLNIIDEFNTKDILKYLDLSFDQCTTLKEFDVELIKSYLSDYAYYNYHFENNDKLYYDRNNLVVEQYYEINDLLKNYVEYENIPKIVDYYSILEIYFEYDVIKKENLFYTPEIHFEFIRNLISNFNIFLNNLCEINELFYKDELYKNSFYYHESLKDLYKLKNTINKTLKSNDLIIEEFINLYGKLYTNINLDQVYNPYDSSNIEFIDGIVDSNISEIANNRILGIHCEKMFKSNLFKDLEEFFEENLNCLEGGLLSELNDLKDIIME